MTRPTKLLLGATALLLLGGLGLYAAADDSPDPNVVWYSLDAQSRSNFCLAYRHSPQAVENGLHGMPGDYSDTYVDHFMGILEREC